MSDQEKRAVAADPSDSNWAKAFSKKSYPEHDTLVREGNTLYGWKCPSCSMVYSPHVKSCSCAKAYNAFLPPETTR